MQSVFGSSFAAHILPTSWFSNGIAGCPPLCSLSTVCSHALSRCFPARQPIWAVPGLDASFVRCLLSVHAENAGQQVAVMLKQVGQSSRQGACQLIATGTGATIFCNSEQRRVCSDRFHRSQVEEQRQSGRQEARHNFFKFCVLLISCIRQRRSHCGACYVYLTHAGFVFGNVLLSIKCCAMSGMFCVLLLAFMYYLLIL